MAVSNTGRVSWTAIAIGWDDGYTRVINAGPSTPNISDGIGGWATSGALATEQLFIFSEELNDLDLPVMRRSSCLELPSAPDVHARVVRILDDCRKSGSELIRTNDIDVGEGVSCHGGVGLRVPTTRRGVDPPLHRLQRGSVSAKGVSAPEH